MNADGDCGPLYECNDCGCVQHRDDMYYDIDPKDNKCKLICAMCESFNVEKV